MTTKLCVGQKVVFVDDTGFSKDRFSPPPVVGQEYIIRFIRPGIGKYGKGTAVHVDGIIGESTKDGIECGFSHWRFAPVEKPSI